MKKVIFRVNNFFGSGHFFDPSYVKKGQKRAGTKIFLVSKNQFFEAHQPCKGFLKDVLYFQTFQQELQMAASNPILRIDV